MIKVAVVSLGCSKNRVDSENMLGILLQNGCEIADDESEADVIIVNTCCFINDAKQESIDAILELAEYKKQNCKRLIVTGCLAERYKDEILSELPEVDAVLGVGHIADIADAVKSSEKQILCEKEFSHVLAERFVTTPEYTAYIKIADGCDNHCTYCVIPSIRGKFKSRSEEDIVAEAESLVKRGARELIIIAQDTTSYGVDLYGEARLCSLLERLCEIDGLKWIRLHYCYPEKITDELIDLIAENEKICKYLDIPIQHCNNDILKKMGRKSSKEQIVSLVAKLREKIPGITLRTTLITGFPTETDCQALEMEQFITDMQFERLGVFSYSQEEGTPAAKMDGQIDEEVKRNRLEMLMFAQAEVAEAKSRSMLGKSIEVLIEGYDPVIKQYFGRSEADSAEIDGKVFVKSKEKLNDGEFVTVKITDYMDYDLFGEREEENV